VSETRNAAAVLLGRLGGLARGKTVLETIPPEKRREYARHAAQRRWAKVRAQNPQSPPRDTPEYQAWYQMRRRCQNPKVKDFVDYGGRGITICEAWESFDVFLRDMGPKPSPSHSLNRIDNDGNYEPNNCHWATPKEQAVNRRPRRRKSASA
jgi:hypothetical protein